jgi:hypothetical protein
MLRFLPWIVAFFLVVGAGVVQGLHTDRWSVSRDLEISAAKLEGLPLVLGNWEGIDEPMNAAEKDLAELVGYKRRKYVNKVNGASAAVLIMCGRPGPIAVHTPDVCMNGDGYRVLDEEIDTPVRELPAMQFKTARFIREDAVASNPVRIYWAWTTDGNWSTPKDPRWRFASAPALFKIYVSWEQAGKEKPKQDDPHHDLFLLLLKDLQGRLSPRS